MNTPGKDVFMPAYYTRARACVCISNYFYVKKSHDFNLLVIIAVRRLLS